MVLLSLLFVGFVFGEGDGEIYRVNDYTLFMSYDDEVSVVAGENLFTDSGSNIYFLESDRFLSVNMSFVGDVVYITVIPSPYYNSSVDRVPFYFCTRDYVRELRRFGIENTGVYCPSNMYAHYLGDAIINYPYEFRIQKDVNGLDMPFMWFVGEGAKGGGGCTCVPTITNVYPFITSVSASYDVNTQDTMYIGIDYVGTGFCSGLIMELWYRPVSSFIVVPIGTSSNFGSDTADCNGGSCKVSSPSDNVGYPKSIDLQQVDNDVDFISKIVCAGQWFDGLTSGVAHSSIIDPVICYCNDEYCEGDGDWVLTSNLVCPTGEFIPVEGDIVLNNYFLAVSGFSIYKGAFIY